MQYVLLRQGGKGGKKAGDTLKREVKTELEIYLADEKTKMDNGESTAYMVNERGNRIRGDSYNRALKKIIERTEINKETTLHHLRHSIATHLLENGLGIEFVRDFLGHSHLEATQIYAKVPHRMLKKL